MRSKRFANRFLALVLAGGASVGAGAAISACYVEEGFVAYAPPPPRAEYVTVQPGFFWVNGYWHRDAGYWRWRPGFYQHVRPGYYYAQPRWEHSGGHYVFHNGGWHAHGRVTVR
jgi:hypothetical protein